MASKMKEDERIERAIRGLLKLPENRRCIDCNSLGPQYVCTTFLTFVCTNCSGIHREFTHRVKSVSMAKFTAEEVSAIQAGGNERARQIYLKEWDPQRHSYPDGSNIHRLRDFIKHVYVDRKYTGERSVKKLPRLKLSDKEESHERKMVIAHYGGSRSPHYDHKYEKSYSGRSSDRSFKYYYDERRSPRYAQQNSRYGGFRRNPVCFEVVDDRIRDDRFGNGRRSDSHRLSTGESKLGSRSPDHIKNIDRSISPAIRPLKYILGENLHPLQVGELSKANNGKDADVSAHNQKITSSSNVGSVDGNPKEHNKANSESLIDLSTNPEPPDSAAAPQTQQKPISMEDGNWAPFRSSAKEKTPQAPNINTLEFLLSELSVPSVPLVNNTSKIPSSDGAPSTASGGNVPVGGISPAAPAQHLSVALLAPQHLEAVLPDSVDASTTASTIDVPVQPSNGAPLEAAPGTSGDFSVNIPDRQQLPSMQQHQLSVSPAADSGSTTEQTTTPVGAVENQPQTSALAPNVQELFCVSAERSIQTVSKPAQDTSTGAGSQFLSVETESSERKELPPDLFTASYSSVPQPVPGWQTGPPHDMGFSMRYYPNAMPVPAFHHASRSTNPFDINDETNQVQVQAPMFPFMASLQGALPHLSAPSGLLHTSSLDNISQGLMQPQSPSYASAQGALPNMSAPSGLLHSLSLDNLSQGLMRPQSPSYASAMAPHSPSFASAISPSAYKGQQVHNNMPPSRPQGIGGFDSDGAVFGSLNTNQQLSGTYSVPITPDSFASKGRNPFG